MKTRPRFTPDDRLKLIGKFRDSSGKIYSRTVAGMIVRISPIRPWRGKSERRQHIRGRRIDRDLASMF